MKKKPAKKVKKVKKPAKKVAKKATKTKAKKKAPKGKKPIGTVTHFFTEISVAIVKFSKDAKVNDVVRFKGTTTDFVHKISEMQYDHKPIAKSKKGKEVGIKVKDRVREGDQVFKEI